MPVLDRLLLYAPRLEFSALVNPAALDQLRHDLLSGQPPADPQLQFIYARLAAPPPPRPTPRQGPLTDPLFLGLIPTRACNLACAYCDFIPAEAQPPLMEVSLARQAVDAYFNLLQQQGHRRAEIHFFGGEPFCAPDLVREVVHYARARAERLGLAVHFEATSNGVFSPRLAEWIGDQFDTLVLSLDGPAEIHDRQRPARNGQGSFEVVARTARLLSESSADLYLRACVTAESVAHLPQIAAWLAVEFRPQIVCFESLTPSASSQQAGLFPPDPWQLAVQFFAAAQVLAPYGIQTLLSTAHLQTCQLSFCPVGKDALIVSPDGSLAACYLLEGDWQARGLDMHLGRLSPGNKKGQPSGWQIDPLALQRVRSLQVEHKPLCRDCFCRYHCAGGCHVNHPAQAAPGSYDSLCLQTRLVTLANLLVQLGQVELAQAWLCDHPARERSAWQANDRWI